MTTPVRVALIGNSFASRVQLPALRWAGGAEVVGLAGHDPEKARRTADEWGIPRSTGQWRELIELDPDLWIVTTPVDLHAEMVSAALETRGAILCEKPFALNAAQARELVEGARGRLALIDHQLRWSPWRSRLRNLVRAGAIGPVRSARVSMLMGSRKRLEAPWSWWYERERGGGALGAIGSHLLDGLQLDLGPVSEVCARLVTHRPTRIDRAGVARQVTADEHASLWLRMASGVQASLETSLVEPAGRGSWIEYVGDEGTLVLEGETVLRGADHDAPFAAITVDDRHVPADAELGSSGSGAFARLLALYLRDVLSAVASGASELPGAATFADGLQTMRVLDAARRSADEGCWVRVEGS